jgi:hypothetical protein
MYGESCMDQIDGGLGKQDWYYGYVKGYNIDGTYFIQFDDGDNADHVAHYRYHFV